MTTYRQGDVLVRCVEAIPEAAVPVAGPVILAHGEVTGHAHAIKAKGARLFEHAGRRFLRLAHAAVLEHQEHAPVRLPRGTYEVVRQVEYHPAEIRTVAD